MKKINTTLFELDVIHETMSHGKIWSMLFDLKDVRDKLVEIRDANVEETFEFDQNVEEVSFIDEQLKYINKNIRTFENALLCHESKVVDKRTTMGELGVFWLN